MKLPIRLVMNTWEKKTQNILDVLQSRQRVWQLAELWELVRVSFCATVIAHLRFSANMSKCHRLGKILQEQTAGQKIGPDGYEKPLQEYQPVLSLLWVFIP